MLGLTAPLRYMFMQVRDWAVSGQRAVSALRSAGHLWRLADLLWVTVLCLWMQGRSAETAELAHELGPLAERLGHTNASWALAMFGMLSGLTVDGDLVAAERQATAGLDRAQAANVVNVGTNYRQLGMVQFLRGDWEAGAASLRLGVEKEPGGTPSVRGGSLGQLAVLRACDGDRTAVQALRDDNLLPRAGQPNTLGQWAVLSSYVHGASELGLGEEISDLYPLTIEALETGAVIGRDMLMWEAVAGMAAAAGEQWDAAETHFRTALRQAQEIPNKIGQPEVRRAYARMLIDRAGPGDKEQARTLLDEAVEMYGTLGMPRHLDMAKEQLV